MIVAPNSPRPRANASAAPATRPPEANGSATRQNVWRGPGPSVRAASTRPGIDGLERSDRLAEVEGAGDERDGEDHRELGKPDREAERVERARREVPGGRMRRSGRSLRPPAGARAAARAASRPTERPGNCRVARKYAAGVPTPRISAIEIAFVFRGHPKRVDGDVAVELVEQLPQAGPRGRSPAPVRARNPAVATTSAASSTSVKPRLPSGGVAHLARSRPAAAAVVPSGSCRSSCSSTPARPPCCCSRRTTAISYRTFGCAQGGILIARTRLLTG